MSATGESASHISGVAIPLFPRSFRLEATRGRILNREDGFIIVVEGFARFQPGLALNRQGQELSPTQPSLRSLTAIMIT